jgi:hypothetical protein
MKLLQILTLLILVASVNAMAAQTDMSTETLTGTLPSEQVEAVEGNASLGDFAETQGNVLNEKDFVVVSNGRPIATLTDIAQASAALRQGGCHKCSPRQICCDDGISRAVLSNQDATPAGQGTALPQYTGTRCNIRDRRTGLSLCCSYVKNVQQSCWAQ